MSDVIGSDDEHDNTLQTQEGTENKESVTSVPLMRVFGETWNEEEKNIPPCVSTSTSSSAQKDIAFALTLSSATFEAGRLEDMEMSVCLVDLGPTEKVPAGVKHGYRRRLTENVLFSWKKGQVGGSSGNIPATGVFTLPAASVNLTVRAFVQLTHTTPSAGGFEPKIYTLKTQKEVDKFLVKEGKRFEGLGKKGDASGGDSGTVDAKETTSNDFIDGIQNPPSQIVAWALLPLTKFTDDRSGGSIDIVSGTTSVPTMFRVKETYSEASVLESAASGTSHQMKSHKPIRCALEFEVAPIADDKELKRLILKNDSPLAYTFASDPSRGDLPAKAWWERITDDEEKASDSGSFLDTRNATRRDLFVYVDSSSIGRRKDTRVRVQLREDDLDIDAKGTRAVVVARAGDGGSEPSESSSSDDENDETLDETLQTESDAIAVRQSNKEKRSRRHHRSSWTHVSTGKTKGGSWCHEVRVRLPPRLTAGHHLVLSVFGKDPDVSSVSVFGGMGGKAGPEVPLGHAVLPLASAADTLSPEIALAALPMRGSKRSALGSESEDSSTQTSKTLQKNSTTKDTSSEKETGIWVGVNGGIENGHDVSLTAVKELLPKYMQDNVRAHMQYVDDKPKPSVFARLRLRSNVHTSCGKIGALWAATAAAAEADELHADDERRALFMGTDDAQGSAGKRPVSARQGKSKSRSGSSLGGASGASRAAVKSATRELCAALREVHSANAEQLLCHFPAVMHLLLTLVAVPPASIAAQVSTDAALVLSASEARATAARAERAARVAAANAEATAAKAAGGAFESSPDQKATPSPEVIHIDTVPDSPVDDTSIVGTPVASPLPPGKGLRDSSSSFGSFGVVSLSETPSPSGASPSVTQSTPPGLVEQAFAAILRVAARVQLLEPGTGADVRRSAPLEVFATKVFDDARCVADWRGAAKAALKNSCEEEAFSLLSEGRGHHTDFDASAPSAALFPKLASLYANRLTETSGNCDTNESKKDASDVRSVCWFVLALVGSGASLDAKRRFKTSRAKFPHLERETDEIGVDKSITSIDGENTQTFSSAPSGPATPKPDDARVSALTQVARVVSAETLCARVEYETRQGLNSGLARLCWLLTNVVGPPVNAGEGDDSDDDDTVHDDTSTWWRGGDGVQRDCTAPFARVAFQIASSHVAKLLTKQAEHELLYAFYTEIGCSGRFLQTASGSTRDIGWAVEDLSFEQQQHERDEMLSNAASVDVDDSESHDGADPASPTPGNPLIASLATATFNGLRSSDDTKRDACAGALFTVLLKHAGDATAQSKSGRAAVAATFAPMLRVLVHRYDAIFDDVQIHYATRRQVLASFLSLARDTSDQPSLWRWLCQDPNEDVLSNDFVRRTRRPPRLVSFLKLMCDALEAFAFDAESGSETVVQDGHRSTATTLTILELLEYGRLEIDLIQKTENESLLKSRGVGRRRSAVTSMGLFALGRGVERDFGKNDSKHDFHSAHLVSPSVTFFEGSLGVVLTAMRNDQSAEAWQSRLAPFIRNVFWTRRKALLQSVLRDNVSGGSGTGTTARKDSDASVGDDSYPEMNSFPPPTPPAPGVTPQTFLENASTLLLRFISERKSDKNCEDVRAEATSCLRTLLESCVDLTGRAVALRPTLTYALCASLYDPLGCAARRGALARELERLRTYQPSEPTKNQLTEKKEKKASDDWRVATADVLGALADAEQRLRALAIAATGRNSIPDIETVVDTEVAVARAFAWAPAAHCKALRSLSSRLESGGHWVEAAEAAATAAWTAMRAISAASSDNATCVWREHDARALADVCASLAETSLETSITSGSGIKTSTGDPSISTGARCGISEISEDKILEHLAEATRLFVKGAHLEAAARVAKTALPAWERARAFGDLARAHEGVAGVYRALHQQPPAGAAGSGVFGVLPPPPGPPPPPATYYRVRLVGTAWDSCGLNGKTWVHREPRDRNLGDMLRRLQVSLVPRVEARKGLGGDDAAEATEGDDASSKFPDIQPLPANGDAGDGACIHVVAVEPVFVSSKSWIRRQGGKGVLSGGVPSARDSTNAPGGSGGSIDNSINVTVEEDETQPSSVDEWNGGGFPTSSRFVFDTPFTRVAEKETKEKEPTSTDNDDDDNESTPPPRLLLSSSVAALRAQWRRRTTVTVDGQFPGLRARLTVTNETTTEMTPAASTAEMLDAQRRAIAAAAEAWEHLSMPATASSVVGGVGAASSAAADDTASVSAAAAALGSLQRSLQGSLAAGVNGGVPAIGEAFFPDNVDEEPSISEHDRSSLIDALDAFVSTCVRAVETHGRAAREAAAVANLEIRNAKGRGKDSKAVRNQPSVAHAQSMERTQGMFVRCAGEVRREVQRALAVAEERHAGDLEGSPRKV